MCLHRARRPGCCAWCVSDSDSDTAAGMRLPTPRKDPADARPGGRATWAAAAVPVPLALLPSSALHRSRGEQKPALCGRELLQTGATGLPLFRIHGRPSLMIHGARPLRPRYAALSETSQLVRNHRSALLQGVTWSAPLSDRQMPSS